VILTRFGDALQQIFGKTFGKHKLGIISPNKTIEGYLGGLIIVFIARLLNVFPSFSLKYSTPYFTNSFTN
jgi:predicted CDP-diglyceride synthetase/phosphatidate cytidylyltransferase